MTDRDDALIAINRTRAEFPGKPFVEEEVFAVVTVQRARFIGDVLNVTASLAYQEHTVVMGLTVPAADMQNPTRINAALRREAMVTIFNQWDVVPSHPSTVIVFGGAT